MRRFIRLAAAAVMTRVLVWLPIVGQAEHRTRSRWERQPLRESPSDVPQLTIALARADEALT
jgi:hypothetical protein